MATILAVEDDDAIRPLSINVLQACGDKVATVRNGREAIAYLSDHSDHDLLCAILLELEMPEMNGWDFRKWQQKHAPFARIPLIMSGARVHSCTYERLRPEAYLDKPIDFDHLLEALRTKQIVRTHARID